MCLSEARKVGCCNSRRSPQPQKLQQADPAGGSHCGRRVIETCQRGETTLAATRESLQKFPNSKFLSTPEGSQRQRFPSLSLSQAPAIAFLRAHVHRSTAACSMRVVVITDSVAHSGASNGVAAGCAFNVFIELVDLLNATLAGIITAIWRYSRPPS